MPLPDGNVKFETIAPVSLLVLLVNRSAPLPLVSGRVPVWPPLSTLEP